MPRFRPFAKPASVRSESLDSLLVRDRRRDRGGRFTDTRCGAEPRISQITKETQQVAVYPQIRWKCLLIISVE